VGLVIDTSALVAVERGRVSAKSLESQLADTPVVLPAVVLAELLVGVHLADTPGGLPDGRHGSRRWRAGSPWCPSTARWPCGGPSSRRHASRPGPRHPRTNWPWPPRPLSWDSGCSQAPTAMPTSGGCLACRWSALCSRHGQPPRIPLRHPRLPRGPSPGGGRGRAPRALGLGRLRVREQRLQHPGRHLHLQPVLPAVVVGDEAEGSSSGHGP
jgi:hypothetical protein